MLLLGFLTLAVCFFFVCCAVRWRCCVGVGEIVGVWFFCSCVGVFCVDLVGAVVFVRGFNF